MYEKCDRAYSLVERMWDMSCIFDNNYVTIVECKRENRRSVSYENEDFTGRDFSHIDFTNATFTNCIFDEADFTNTVLYNVKAEKCSFRKANFTDAILASGNFRFADLEGCNLSGANCFYALFEYANMKGIIDSPSTKFYRLYCPETGGFVAYKKCVENRIVTLYIPPDAIRLSATGVTCRTNKVKVLMIESFEGDERFEEAYSLAAEGFLYQVGTTIIEDNINLDRWMDSTSGIHFFMTKEEAKQY